VNETKRIQRQRTRGWRMPPNTRYVGRPTIWGNPFRASVFGLETAIALYRDSITGCWNPSTTAHLDDATCDTAYELHYQWQKRLSAYGRRLAIHDLEGCDLACWCPLDKACHADVLLLLARGVEV